MFIAVINENFEIAEEAKRSQQVGHYFQATQGPDKTWGPWINRLNPYRWFKPSPRAIVVENLPSNLVLPMQKALVQDYGLPMPERRPTRVSFLLSLCFCLLTGSCLGPVDGEPKTRAASHKQVT
jgi:voltage-dependent calcium channel